MSVDTAKVETVAGDGGDAPVTDERLKDLKAIVEEIKEDATDSFNQARQDNENTLLAKWAGQSPDGRKRKKYLSEDPKPFEGATDSRVRLADQIVAEQRREVVAAATRAMPSVVATESGDESAAAKTAALLKYIIKNRWGASFRREIKLLYQYMASDTPAVSVAYVDWFTERGVAYAELTADEVVAQFLEQLQGDEGSVQEEDIREAMDLVMNPLRVEELAGALANLLPEEIPTARIKKVAKDLVETGRAEYPAPYDKINEPRMEALRVGEDIFYPFNTCDLQRARGVVLRRWYSRAEALEKAATERWTQEFVDQLLGKDEGEKGKEGQTAFNEFEDAAVVLENSTGNADIHAGLYEVLYIYSRAANEDGVLGIYVDTISYFCDVAACDRKLWDRRHGKYPFVAFGRECLTRRINDSRGVPELAVSDQQSRKLLRDSFEDHVQTGMNPPIIKPRNRPFFRAQLAPFGEIEADSRDQIRHLDRPPYPAAADRYWKEIRRETNEYWARYDAETNPNEGAAVLASQERVDDFLACLADVFRMVVQLCQQYMTDEEISRIVGGRGMPIARTVAEIQGQYDIQLSFDVEDLDKAKLIKKAEVVLKHLRPMDVHGMLPYDDMLRQIASSLDPNWGERIPDVQSATARVVTEEQNNFVQIMNGVEPDMPEQIDAPGVRLEILTQLMMPRLQNPAAYSPLSAMSRLIYDNRIKYLEFQSQQIENADVGRVGTEPVDQAAMAAGGAP